MIYNRITNKNLSLVNSLLTSWSAERDKDESELQWDLCLAPLVFGPVAVLDNMICDNYALYNFLLKEKHQVILRSYVKKGRIQLWHREFYKAGEKINCVEDILKNWLCRNNHEAINNVEFGMLHRKNVKNVNEDIRKNIRKWNKDSTIAEKDRIDAFYEIMKGYFPNYDEYIELLNDIFFVGGKERGLGIYKSYPSALKFRFLTALGIKNPESFIYDCNISNKVLYQSILVSIEKKKLRDNAKFSLEETLLLCELAHSDMAAKEFFSLLLEKNPNVTELKAVCGLIQNKISLSINNLLNDVYDTGIAEANNTYVLCEVKKEVSFEKIAFNSEMNEIVNLVESKLDDHKFNSLFQNNPISLNDYKKRFNEFNKVLEVETHNELSVETIDNIKRFLSYVSVATAPFDFGNPLIKIFIAGLGAKPGEDIVDLGAVIYRKICKNEQTYHKLMPDFYKYGELKIKSIEIVKF